MELPEGFRRILAGTVFLAIALSLLFGLAWVMGTAWDSGAERLAPVIFLLFALLLPRLYTSLIRPSESNSVRLRRYSRVRYRSVLGYAALATVVVWVVILAFRWFFRSFERHRLALYFFSPRLLFSYSITSYLSATAAEGRN